MVRVTVEKVANAAGVSKATVSRVLNNNPYGVSEATRSRVRKVLDDLKYNSIGERYIDSKTIALIVPDITNSFFAELARAVVSKAREEHYQVLLENTENLFENEEKCILNLVSKNISGIILVSTVRHCRKCHRLPEQYGIPMILLDRNLMGEMTWNGVFVDNEFASYECCRLLIQNGARKIAYIEGPHNSLTAYERLQGYKRALSENEIGFSRRLVKPGNYTVESGYNAVMELERAGEDYTAILAANDLMALGAIKALQEFRYRIPQDKEVVGFDNIIYAQYSDPPLTTVQQPTLEMGSRAVDILLKSLAGYSGIDVVSLKPRLIERASTS